MLVEIRVHASVLTAEHLDIFDERGPGLADSAELEEGGAECTFMRVGQELEELGIGGDGAFFGTGRFDFSRVADELARARLQVAG
jgi:hypothetical protein